MAKILLVEDDKTIGKLVALQLEREHHLVERRYVAVVEQQDVVGLDVQASETEIGRTRQHLEWPSVKFGDEDLVVLQILEAGAGHIVPAGALAQTLRCLGFGAAWQDMTGRLAIFHRLRIVDDYA